MRGLSGLDIRGSAVVVWPLMLQYLVRPTSTIPKVFAVALTHPESSRLTFTTINPPPPSMSLLVEKGIDKACSNCRAPLPQGPAKKFDEGSRTYIKLQRMSERGKVKWHSLPPVHQVSLSSTPHRIPRACSAAVQYTTPVPAEPIRTQQRDHPFILRTPRTKWKRRLRR